MLLGSSRSAVLLVAAALLTALFLSLSLVLTEARLWNSGLMFASSSSSSSHEEDSSSSSTNSPPPIAHKPSPKKQQPPSPPPPSPSQSSSQPPRNVLLLIADDFKPLLPSYGSPHVSKAGWMSNLDKLAEDGITFRNAHAQMSICGPSRASFLTSLRPDTLNIYNIYPNMLGKLVQASRKPGGGKEILLLPKLFKLAGYATYGAGKVSQESEYMILSDRSMWTHPTYNAHKRGGSRRAFSSPFAGSWIDSPDVPDTHFADGQAANLTARLISTQLGRPPAKDTSAQPWFLALGLWKPHLPWNVPKRYYDMAGPADGYVSHHDVDIAGLKPGFQSIVYGEGCTESRAYGSGINIDYRRTTEKNLRLANRGYHAAALFMNAQMGIVLDALDQSPHNRDNTIVVFLGDHGYHLGDHGLYCKHTNLEQGTKVPFIFRPALMDTHYKRGTHSFAPVELLDLMPTLYDMAQLTIDRTQFREWEGVSLMPIVRDPLAGWVKAGAVSQYAHRRRGKFVMGYTVRTTRYRVTNWRDYFHEMYDYVEDAWETRTIKNDTQRKAVLMKLLRGFTDKRVMNTRPFDFDDRDAVRGLPPPEYA